MKAETEGLVIAAQDQSLPTRWYYQHKIINNGTDPKCRLCHEFNESIEHILSGCPTLAKKEHLARHDKAFIYIHWNIPDKWYEHKLNTVIEGKDVTMLWDVSIYTDKEIKANRPDIVIKDKANHLCTLIDMTVLSERNVAAKEAEKISKYKDLEIEISKMWNTKTTFIPFVIGALGLTRRRMNPHIEKIPRKVKIEELLKSVLLGIAHFLRRTLSMT